MTKNSYENDDKESINEVTEANGYKETNILRYVHHCEMVWYTYPTLTLTDKM